MTTKIKVCKWNACGKANSQFVFDRAADALKLSSEWWEVKWWEVSLEFCGCLWMCKNSVNVKIEKEGKKEEIKSWINPLKMAKIIEPFKKFKNKEKK